MNEKLLSEKFKKKVGVKKINAYGLRQDIDTSEILTKLIQEVGRYCEYCASDLFIEWEIIRDKVINDSFPIDSVTSFLFGLRQMGVDSADMIYARYDRSDTAYLYYRKIYRLDIYKSESTYLIMTLYEVNIPMRLKED